MTTLIFGAGEGFVNQLLDFFGRSLLALLEVKPDRL
jgi:hypothetical protein